MAEESLRLFRQVGSYGIALALRHVGLRLADQGHLEQGAARLEEALVVAHSLSDTLGIINAL